MADVLLKSWIFSLILLQLRELTFVGKSKMLSISWRSIQLNKIVNLKCLFCISLVIVNILVKQ